MSVTLATCRSATAALADQSDLTYQDSAASNVGPGAVIATLSVASALTVAGEHGDIESVIIGARGALLQGSGTIIDQHLTWTLGTESASSPMTLSSDATAFATVESTAQTTKPGGGAWTWQDVADLTAVGVEADVELDAGESATMRIAEVYVRVLGAAESSNTPATVVADDIEPEVLADNLTALTSADNASAAVVADDVSGEVGTGE